MSIIADKESSDASPTEQTSVQGEAKDGTARIHHMDNLRAIAMLLGVYLHAALAYADPAQSVWVATDPGSNVAIDVSIWFIHLFRMALFFLLAGYFAKLTVDRKGIRQFLWNRTVRIAGPFLLSYPFMLVAMTAAIVFAISYIENPKGLIGLIVSSQDSPDAPKEMPPTTMHLWFLYYLFFFVWISAAFARWATWKFDWLFDRPVLLWLTPILLVPAVFGSGVPLPAPESFIPHWWPFAFFGLFYWGGWQLFGREAMLERLQPYTGWMLGCCGLLFLLYYWMMPVLDLSILLKGRQSTTFGTLLLESILTAYLSVLLTIVSLLLGKKYLQRRNASLSFFADASYWVYLIHLPIVVWLQTLLVPLPWSPFVKLAAILILTMVACLGSYIVFVRYTPIGWLLHGKRSFP